MHKIIRNLPFHVGCKSFQNKKYKSVFNFYLFNALFLMLQVYILRKNVFGKII